MKDFNHLSNVCGRIANAMSKGRDALAVKHLNQELEVRDKQIKDTLLSMQRIHKHNSIPCLVDEDKLGCVICVRNKTIKEMLEKLCLN